MIVLDKTCGCGRHYEVQLRGDRKLEKMEDGTLGIEILPSDRWCGKCVPPQQAKDLVGKTHFSTTCSWDNLGAKELLKINLNAKCKTN